MSHVLNHLHKHIEIFKSLKYHIKPFSLHINLQQAEPT